MKKTLLALALAGVALAGCDRKASHAPPSLRAKVPVGPPIVAAHYFGNAWAVNFTSGFRRADVPADFARLSADGFNAVVLVVPWGDFQPVIEPCCGDDERAWERLRFLLDQAREARLKVILRVGYPWTLHPQSDSGFERVRKLMNRRDTRVAYARFVQRLGHEVDGRPEVILAFMSWEDQQLFEVDEGARDDYRQFLAQGARDAGYPTDHLPTREADPVAFNAYWDWLAIEKLYRPSLAALPMLSYEARIDKEPVYQTGADGVRRIDRWIGHPGMLHLPAGRPVTIYWSPFWGARNEGEKLSADASLRLFGTLLAEVGANAPTAPIFIDQLNVVDNTPGHEHNAALEADAVADFLDRAGCVMKANAVSGYSWWTTRDYRHSPVYNPAFGYGLEGWSWRGAGDGQAALEALPMGDFQLRLAPGQGVSQRLDSVAIPDAALPAPVYRVCVTADAAVPTRLAVNAGPGAATFLSFAAAGVQSRCADLASAPAFPAPLLSLRVLSGDLAVRDVQFFDHVQTGGLYDPDGRPGPLHAGVRRMNLRFQSETAAQCSPPSP